jgi:uncharacterized protein
MRPLDILFTVPEQRLLAAVMADPGRDFGTVELLDRIGSSRSAGSALLNRWVEAALLRERRVGNQRRLAVNPDFLLYQELRRIAVKTVGLTEPLADALSPVADRLREAYVFGSVAAGTDHGGSDIDVALIGDVSLFEVSPLLDRAQELLGRAVHVNIYSAGEWDGGNDAVLQSIKTGPLVDLKGGMNGKADRVREPAAHRRVQSRSGK